MLSSAESQRRHRQRLREQGKTEVLLKLPVEVVATLDRLRVIHGGGTRGDVVVSLIRQVTEAGSELKKP